MTFEREYYEREYGDYRSQNPLRKLDFYRKLAERAAGPASSPRILDIGCAFGLFLAQLGGKWIRHGVDASSYAIAQARAARPEIQFEVTSSGSFSSAGPFDVITAFDVLEHLPELDSALLWIAGNLRPGGGFVFVVPVYDGPTGPIIRLLDHDPTHLHQKSRAFWLELAGRHFEVVDWYGIYRYLLPGNHYLHWVTRRLRKFAPALACLARPRS